jgi:ABC-type oligopeptide transport system substrate-binding subunit
LEKAQTLFAEGLAELGLNAGDVTINLISRNNEPYSTANAALQEIFQNAFGITVVAEPLDRSSYSARRADYSYDFCLVSWGADWDDATTFIHYFYIPEVTDSGANVYSNDAFNEPYKKALYESDEAVRQTEFGKAESVLMEDVPRIPIWSEGQYYAVGERLAGVHTRAVVPYVDIINADILE